MSLEEKDDELAECLQEPTAFAGSGLQEPTSSTGSGGNVGRGGHVGTTDCCVCWWDGGI